MKRVKTVLSEEELVQKGMERGVVVLNERTFLEGVGEKLWFVGGEGGNRELSEGWGGGAKSCPGHTWPSRKTMCFLSAVK